MDAWADPAAILEMMAHPGDELCRSAIVTLASSVEFGRVVPFSAMENLSLAVRSGWESSDNIFKIALIMNCAKKNEKVAREVAALCLSFLRGIYGRSSSPMFIKSYHEEMLADSINEFCHGGYLEPTPLGGWLSAYEDHPLRIVFRWCQNPRFDIVRRIGAELSDEYGIDRLYIGEEKMSLFQYVCSYFKDPIFLLYGSVKVS